MGLPRFYPIFDDVNWLARMLPLGVKFVQLRIKDQPVEVLREQIADAQKLCMAHDAILVVNDYWEIAIEQVVRGCTWGRKILMMPMSLQSGRPGLNWVSPPMTAVSWTGPWPYLRIM